MKFLHRYEMKKVTVIPSSSKEIGQELSVHFIWSPHGTKDVRVHILDNNPKRKKTERHLLEDY